MSTFKRPRFPNEPLTSYQWFFEMRLDKMKYIMTKGYPRPILKLYLANEAVVCREYMRHQLVSDAPVAQ